MSSDDDSSICSSRSGCDIYPRDIMFGDNGDRVHITSDSFGMDLHFKLIRGMNETEIKKSIKKILETNDFDQIQDLFVLAFATRNCRGGKGERDLFYSMFLELSTNFPKTCLKLIGLIPQFGYWKDLLNLAPLSNDMSFRYYCMRVLADQLIKDSKTLNKSEISLAAKWAPRENGLFFRKNTHLYENLVNQVYIQSGSNETISMDKFYRKLVAKLCQQLDVVEIKMCTGKYSEIDYSKAPSVGINKFKKAHLNEIIESLGDIPDGGNRFPENPDRVQGRNNFLKTIKTGNVKGGQLQPHQIIENFNEGQSESVVELLEAQWADIRKNISEKNPKSILAMIDNSGSMDSGCGNVRPIDVSIAMGILLSEVSTGPFKNRAITFSGKPTFLDFSFQDSLEGKIKKVKNVQINASNTNLIAAFKLILNLAIAENLTSSQIPDLVIFSDMQFDSAVSDSKSTFQVIDKMFHDNGLVRPTIIYWNLNSKDGVPVTGSTPNTVLMSGYSPSLFKYLMFGEKVEEVTPYSIYRLMLDDPMYDPIRDVLKTCDHDFDEFSRYKSVNAISVSEISRF